MNTNFKYKTDTGAPNFSHDPRTTAVMGEVFRLALQYHDWQRAVVSMPMIGDNMMIVSPTKTKREG